MLAPALVSQQQRPRPNKTPQSTNSRKAQKQSWHHTCREKESSAEKKAKAIGNAKTEAKKKIIAAEADTESKK